MFVAGDRGDIQARGAQFYASRMLTSAWLGPSQSADDVYPAATSVRKAGYPLITAYAVHRSDGLWSVMLVNKDDQSHTVDVQFNVTDASSWFEGTVKVTTFGQRQYVWRSRGRHSRPDPDGGPITTAVDASRVSSQPLFSIPARSITVLTGSTSQERVCSTCRVTRRAPR
jgi:hypothetical protein